MTTISADTLPDALSAPVREFVAKPHQLLIGSERLDAADGRTFATLDPSSGREIATGRPRRRGGRRPRRRRGARRPSRRGRGRACRRPGASS